MLIGIISDIHDNIANLEICLAWCRKNGIKKIICCGDVCNSDTLRFLAQNFEGDISLVDGNGELFTPQDAAQYKNIDHQGEIGFEVIENLSIGFCHQSRDIEKIKKSGKNPDFIFYGHSHKPSLEKQDGIFISNPGNIAGIFFQATFATLDTGTKTLELIMINDITG